MEVTEQPTAPYLDAVVGYAFRGPGRYHVPGHKGGSGADPGVVKAIGLDGLAADVPQDIQGIDLGPSPTPYERAELLAAEAFGAARTFFLTNGATQGNHTLCLALATLAAIVVATAPARALISINVPFAVAKLFQVSSLLWASRALRVQLQAFTVHFQICEFEMHGLSVWWP